MWATMRRWQLRVLQAQPMPVVRLRPRSRLARALLWLAQFPCGLGVHKPFHLGSDCTRCHKRLW